MAGSFKNATGENLAHVLAEHQNAPVEAAALPSPLIPFPLPILPDSGLYAITPWVIAPTIGQSTETTAAAPTEAAATTVAAGATPGPITMPGPLPIPIPILISEELRVDADGFYPQMKCSGRIAGPFTPALHWIANVAKTAPHTYEGSIFYKEGNLSLLPQTHIKVVVSRSFLSPLSATATFTNGGPLRTRTLAYKSRYFHPVNFEFDVATGVLATLDYNTGSHPNRPASLPVENLTIANVYRRAGFDVSLSGGNDTVPIIEAGADAKWSDTEMHDAMQAHWSRFANAPQWAVWTFFASLHESGTSLGGIMFDDIGANQRQGTSLFVDSFIKNPPAGDPAPAAFVRRMIFWTACHEMGHTFNLAHSWQKALPTSWIPLANEPLARSFMNYPFNVPGGTTAFFSDFQFRFSDQELLYMRHAPFRFVQQGNALWFDDHGFQQNNISAEPKFTLTLEGPRAATMFDFLEPVVLHLKLRNVSGNPVLVDEKILSSADRMTVILKKKGKPARELLAYSRKCWQEKQTVLKPGEEMMDSLFASAGRNGWDLAEPGYYNIQVALRMGAEDVISQPLAIRVAPPRGYEEEFLAQDFFSDNVGRVLDFDGSGGGTPGMEAGNNTLRELLNRMPDHRAAIHSRVALAGPLATNYKRIEIRDGKSALKVARQDMGEAHGLLAVLNNDPQACIGTLGSVDYRYYCERFNEVLKEKDRHKAAMAKAR